MTSQFGNPRPGKTHDVHKIGFYGDPEEHRQRHIPNAVINPLPFSIGAEERRQEVNQIRESDKGFELQGIKIKPKPKPTTAKSQPQHLVTPYVYVEKVVNPKKEPEGTRTKHNKKWNGSNNYKGSMRIEHIKERRAPIQEQLVIEKAWKTEFENLKESDSAEIERKKEELIRKFQPDDKESALHTKEDREKFY